MEYIAYLHKDRTSDFGVSFPDFPGCVTAGKTLQEARVLAVEALKLHVQGMIEDGETIPEPSTLDDLANDPAMAGSVAVLVALESLEKTVRVNITARKSQIEKIDQLADRAGLSRSAYMVRKAISDDDLTLAVVRNSLSGKSQTQKRGKGTAGKGRTAQIDRRGGLRNGT